MPLLILTRALGSLVSLAVLAACGYLLWTWYDGLPILLKDGSYGRVHEDWRLWTGLAVLVISSSGQIVFAPFLGRRDTPDTLLKLERAQGRMIDTPTGASVYVEEIGSRSKPTLILTHGWGLDSTIWQYAKRDLGDAFHIVVWELPGLGRSKAGSKRTRARRASPKTSKPLSSMSGSRRSFSSDIASAG